MTLRSERRSTNTHDERARLLRSLGDHGRAPRARTAAHAASDEHQVGVGKHVANLLFSLESRLFANLRVAARPKAARALAAEEKLVLGVRLQQVLRVRIHRDELRAVNPDVHHAVNRVATAASRAHHVNARHALGEELHELLVLLAHLRLRLALAAEKLFLALLRRFAENILKSHCHPTSGLLVRQRFAPEHLFKVTPRTTGGSKKQSNLTRSSLITLVIRDLQCEPS